jgi:hypothetical protein
MGCAAAGTFDGMGSAVVECTCGEDTWSAAVDGRLAVYIGRRMSDMPDRVLSYTPGEKAACNRECIPDIILSADILLAFF